MTRVLVFVLLAAMTAFGTEMPSAPVSTDQGNPVTFNKDVLPILQNNCQTCHRPSGIAPMSLLTYENARPWAKAIKAAVVSKMMPPWFADPHYGEFRNAPKLTVADIQTLTAWVDGGAREGNPGDKPAAIQWTDGWRVKPDIVVSMREPQTGQGAFTTMEAVYAPGSQPLDFRSSNFAKLIPAGKPIRLEVHYTPNGKATTDRTMVGFTLAKAPAQRRFIIMAPEHLVDSRKPIRAGAANWQTKGELTFNQDAELVRFMPHMHLRGKDMTFQLIYPDGRKETVLSAKFNFHWQLGYEVENPIKVTQGTRMVVTAHHDNSANNPSNPAPDQDAIGGA